MKFAIRPSFLKKCVLSHSSDDGIYLGKNVYSDGQNRFGWFAAAGVGTGQSCKEIRGLQA
jgi:hypothetical protein